MNKLNGKFGVKVNGITNEQTNGKSGVKISGISGGGAFARGRHMATI
jgi:hypothetical protein